MPLPGGPADKFGNRYELSWTVAALVRMLHGDLDSLRIEDPGVTKAEFVAFKNGRRELHQAKRSRPEGKWSLSSLAATDTMVLQAIFEQLKDSSDHFIFVSGSDAPELRELAHRAEHASSLTEFESVFTASKEQRRLLKQLIALWHASDTSIAYDVLKRTSVETVDERNINEKIEWGIRALFLSDPRTVDNELRRLAEASIHKILTRDGVVAHLQKLGFRLRHVIDRASAAACVDNATQRYLESVRSKLIQKSLIPRATTKAFLEKLDQQLPGGDFALLGKAGTGKTGCVVELIDSLRARHVPVLAFRLDRLEPTSSSADLGKQIGFEESPALVLAEVTGGKDAVLLVDQLDAVSTVSGRSSAFFDAVEAMLVEARGLRLRAKIHVVVVCRAFDWENDHRLRRLLHEKHEKLEVTGFSPDEVNGLLVAAGYDKRMFQPRQLELLRLPQNLALFLEAGFGAGTAPTFNTAKELFDKYWDEKRRAVHLRARPNPEQWSEVITTLCDEMTLTQQLSVVREKLDRFNGDNLLQMASEGVITFDGKRYGFGHESFFDYCFARTFVAGSQTLVESITGSEQHLFRRAQVRQVLAYLRDAMPTRYDTELRELLTCAKVRFHLKDLALSLLFTVPNPTEEEWAMAEPWLSSQVQTVGENRANTDAFSNVVWSHFFASGSWFHLADRHGYIASWLGSENEDHGNLATNYLRLHQRNHGDRVAELLESKIGHGDAWKPRLRHIMEWAQLEGSRRLFDLFLRLIDDGTLDEARGPIAANSTFWSMLYGLAKARPDWVPEVIAHWLRRRLLLAREQCQEDETIRWRDLFGHDQFGAEHFHDSARAAPVIFVTHVLPVVLTVTDAAAHPENDPPHRDGVWPVMLDARYESLDSACLNSLVEALQEMAQARAGDLDAIVAELQRRETYTANFLLLNFFIGGINHFADQAATLLCEQPWRFESGYSGSTYWVAMELIRVAIPLCAPEKRKQLELTILDYCPKFERTKSGRHYFGNARFELLSAIPSILRSISAQARFEELERKFGKPSGHPDGPSGGFVGSPIEQQAAAKMTDSQWLSAIAEYQTDLGKRRWRDLTKGGAIELSRVLEERARTDPIRFAKLGVQFLKGTHPAYMDAILRALKGARAPIELKLEVCRKAFAEYPLQYGSSLADLVGSVDAPLPEDVVQMLVWLATEDPDPKEELWNIEATGGTPYYGGKILDHGINTTRGRAAGAMANLIRSDPAYTTRFHDALDHMVVDPSVAVRSCVAEVVLVVAQTDTSLAFRFFEKLVSADDRLLATHFVSHFIYYGMRAHFSKLRQTVERMVRSQDSRVNKHGSRLVALAALHGHDVDALVDEAFNASASHRVGIAQVAAANVALVDCRKWCEDQLLKLFNDTDEKVRTYAASSFRNLKGAELENYEDLVSAFCDSPAFETDSFALLHLLEESVCRLPGITCNVCHQFLARFSDQARDIRTGRSSDAHTMTKLVFRTYHQHQNDEWGPRCLDLIDSMCLEGLQDVRSGMEAFDR